MNQHVSFATQDHRPWQAVEYEIVCKMVHAGKTDDEIAHMLKRTRRGVYDARGRLGLTSPVPLKYWTDADVETMASMFLAGKTDAQIAEHLGRSRDAVITKRQSLGIVRDVPPALPAVNRPKVLASNIMQQRPCPIHADYEERVRANAAYLIAGMRAGHPVFSKGRGPE